MKQSVELPVPAALTALAAVAASDGTATVARRLDPHARRAWETDSGDRPAR